MPIARFQMPDGRIARFEVPEGTTPEQAQSMIAAQVQPKRDIASEIENDPISRAAREGGVGTGFQNFAAGAGKSLTDTFRGVAQLVGAGPSSAEMSEIQKRDAPLMDTGAGLAGNITGGVVQSLPLMGVGAPASILGRIGQGAAIGAGFSGTQPVSGEDYWSDKATQVGTGAAIGAAIPAGLEVAKQGVRGATHAYRGTIEPFFQKGRNMAEGRDYVKVAGDRAQELAAALKSNQSSVPGYKPTAAEVAASLPANASKSGQAEFAGLQANVAPSAPSTQAAVTQEQNKALADSLRSFGGDKASLEAAIAERNAVTGPMRETALSNANIAGIKGPQLQERIAGQKDALVNALQDTGRFQTTAAQQANLANGGVITKTAGGRGLPSPSAYPVSGYPRIGGKYTENIERVPEALSAASETAQIAANRRAQAGLSQYQLDSLAAHGQFPLDSGKIVGKINTMLSTPGDRAVTLNEKVLTAVRDKIKSLTNKEGVIDAHDLYAIRKTDINDVVSNLTKDMDASTKVRAGTLVSSIKKSIDDAIESAGGTGWKDYLKLYASKSKDIDQQKIGQALEGKLTSALQGDAAIRPQMYATALKETSHLPQTAAGLPRYTKLEDVLTPQNMQTVNNVGDTLATKAMAKELSGLGSKRASELTGTPEIMIPPTLSRTGMITRYLARLLQGKGTTQMDQEMARDMMTNTPQVARLMEDAKSREQKIKILVEFLQRQTPVAVGGATMNQGQQ